MTQQYLAGSDPIHYPSYGSINASTWGSFTSNLADGQAEGTQILGLVRHSAPASSKNISKVHIMLRAIVNAGGSDVQLSIQGISGAAGPVYRADGTIKGATNNGQATVDIATLTANAMNTFTLGEVVAVNYNQPIAICIGFAAGTYAGADTFNVGVINGQPGGGIITLGDNGGYGCVQLTGAGPTYARQDGIVGDAFLEFDDGTFGRIHTCFPTTTLNQSVSLTSSGTAEAAMTFQLNSPHYIAGMRCLLGGTPGDFLFALYGAASAPAYSDALAVSGTHDLNAWYVAATIGWNEDGWATPILLSAATTYRVAVRATTTTAVLLYYFDLGNANHFQAHALGVNGTYTTRTGDGATWAAATTTRRPFIELLLVSAGDDAAGGGLNTHPGMGGGMAA